MYNPDRSIPQRELRNNIGSVLAEVEAGKTLTVTVHGRPVAELRPIEKRPEFISGEDFLHLTKEAPLDQGFSKDVNKVLGQTIDEL